MEKIVLNQKNIHPKLSDGIVDMIISSSLPYFGEFSQFLNFQKNEQVPTAGVNATTNGLMFHWNPEFISSLTPGQIKFLILHEEMHLILDHPHRGVGYDQRLANVAMDMIINQTIHDEIIKPGITKVDKFNVEIPKDEQGNNSALFIPKEYKGKEVFEELYQWLSKKKDKMKQQGKGKGKGQSQGKGQGQGQGDGQGQGQGQNQGDGQGQKPDYGQYGKNGVDMYSADEILKREIENEGKGNVFDIHMDDEVPAEMKKEMVQSAVQALKNRGLQSGTAESVLNKLVKKRKDYLKEIKRTISNEIFGSIKNKTITRPNRRGIVGLKGFKKYSVKINCILDTSGSMSNEFDKVLSYIFQNDISINLIQIDTKVQDVVEIKNKKELEKMKIKGLGGTILQPAVDYLKDPKNGINKYNTVILTDGYTDSLDFSNYKGKVLILSTEKSVPISNDNGNIKQIENIGKQDY